jgi:hypothetical protein
MNVAQPDFQHGYTMRAPQRRGGHEHQVHCAGSDSSGHTAHRGHDGNVAPATANSHEGHVPVYDSVVLFRYGDHYTTSFMNLSTGKATIKQDKQAHTVTISVKKKTDGMVGVRYGFDVPKG